MPIPLREDIKPGAQVSEIPLSDMLTVLAKVLNSIDGKAGAILITKPPSGQGWTIAVVPDGQSLEVAGGKLRVKVAGIRASHMAAGSVTTKALDENAVTGPKIASAAVDASKMVGFTGAVSLNTAYTLYITNGSIQKVV